MAIKAILLNLLCVLAAYGFQVLCFQDGWGAGCWDCFRPDGLNTVVMVICFCALFGLSMDYEVFILSAVRESWLDQHNMRLAVQDGFLRVAGIITSAAVIMVSVFLSFAFGDVVEIEQLGVGLSFAVLLDATVIRLFPCALHHAADGPLGLSGCRARRCRWRNGTSMRTAIRRRPHAYGHPSELESAEVRPLPASARCRSIAAAVQYDLGSGEKAKRHFASLPPAVIDSAGYHCSTISKRKLLFLPCGRTGVFREAQGLITFPELVAGSGGSSVRAGRERPSSPPHWCPGPWSYR